MNRLLISLNKAAVRGFVFSIALLICVPAYSQSDLELRDLVSPETSVAITGSPQELLALPLLKLIPHEVIEVWGKEQLGISLKEATEMIGIVERIDNRKPPHVGVVVRFGSPQTFKGMINESAKSVEKDGQTYYVLGRGRQQMALSFRGANTMLFGTPELISQFDKKRSEGGPMRKLMEKDFGDAEVQAFVAVEPLRDFFAQNLPPRDRVPEPFQNFLELPELVEYVHMGLSLKESPEIVTRVGAVDADSVEKLRRIQVHSQRMTRAAAMAELANKIGDQSEEMQLAVNQYAERVFDQVDSMSEPIIEGNEMIYKVNPQDGGVQIATIGILTGMLLPAVQQVRFASRRVKSLNNLRQLTLAVLNYESAFMRFPRQAMYSEEGEPLLSWRVTILPYIEQNALYNEFHLDEPWDSPHNIKLLDRMPEVYGSPNVGDLEGKTVYLGFNGDKTMFPSDNPKRKMTFGNLVDGSSNTILFVEANEAAAVEWTKPADIPFDPEVDVTAVGDLLPGGFNCAFCDGSTHFISSEIDPESLKHLIMPADGNIVNLP